MKILIVNADDYGRTPNVSRGIRDAHQHGIVTSTTAMMNLPGVEKALHEAQTHCPQLGLGVHLVLTAGAPVLPEKQVKTLVGNGGRFFSQKHLETHANELDPAHVRSEWRAQIEKFLAVMGHTPDHLDSHHHTSYSTPPLFETMLDLAAEYKCAVRRPFSHDDSESAQQFFALQALATRRVPHPDHLVTSFYAERATRQELQRILETLREGVTEIMSHPGYTDQELERGSSYNIQREAELKILTDSALPSILKDLGVELRTFGALSSFESNRTI